MATFKIRDLMVAIRPGVQTPQRPKPLEDCDPDLGSIVCLAVPDSGGGCGDTAGCGDTCADTAGCGGCSLGCTETVCGGCTAGGATCEGCTFTCGCTCTVTCGATCGLTDWCAGSVAPKAIAQMSASDLANLKTQLRVAMQKVGQRENVLAAAAEARAIVPQTLAQVDALQQKLSEAMDELRARRSEIEKAAKRSSKKGADDKK